MTWRRGDPRTPCCSIGTIRWSHLSRGPCAAAVPNTSTGSATTSTRAEEAGTVKQGTHVPRSPCVPETSPFRRSGDSKWRARVECPDSGGSIRAESRPRRIRDRRHPGLGPVQFLLGRRAALGGRSTSISYFPGHRLGGQSRWSGSEVVPQYNVIRSCLILFLYRCGRSLMAPVLRPALRVGPGVSTHRGPSGFSYS